MQMLLLDQITANLPICNMLFGWFVGRKCFQKVKHNVDISKVVKNTNIKQ